MDPKHSTPNQPGYPDKELAARLFLRLSRCLISLFLCSFPGALCLFAVKSARGA